jgi:hypothetical protein
LLSQKQYNWLSLSSELTRKIVSPKTGSSDGSSCSITWNVGYHASLQKYPRGTHLWARTGTGESQKSRQRKYNNRAETHVRKIARKSKQIEKKRRTWEESFQFLVSYKERNGDCKVPHKYEKDKSLGCWVIDQRKYRRKGSLSEDRISKLDSIGFTWNPHDDNWNAMFEQLLSYKERNGGCNVPQKYEEGTGLGLWVSNQRLFRRKGSLSEDRIAKLDSIGFTWDPHDDNWNSMFEQLLSYKERNGDCNVPARYEKDKSLGLWVFNQRQFRRKSSLSEDRIAKLDSIGFTWDPLDDNWNSMFEQLLSYKQSNGDCNVPQKYEKDIRAWPLGLQTKTVLEGRAVFQRTELPN